MTSLIELPIPEYFFLYERMKSLQLIDLLHYSLLAHKAGWDNLPSEVMINFSQMQIELKISHPTYRASLKRLIKAKLLHKITKHKYLIVDFRSVAGEMEEVPNEVR